MTEGSRAKEEEPQRLGDAIGMALLEVIDGEEEGRDNIGTGKPSDIECCEKRGKTILEYERKIDDVCDGTTGGRASIKHLKRRQCLKGMSKWLN